MVSCCAGTIETLGANGQRTWFWNFAEQNAQGKDEFSLRVEFITGGTPADTCMREES